MVAETWIPKPLEKDYLTSEEVSAIAGVERVALYNWVRAGLLPRPTSTRGRGIIARWPLISGTVAQFVRSQRDLGFGLADVRARLVEAFGERILDVLAPPRTPKRRSRPRPAS